MKGKLPVYLENAKGILQLKVRLDTGFIVGNINKKELVFELIGKPSFDETMDDMMSAIYHICQTADMLTKNKQSEEIYKRTVQAFSLVMDKFNPEAKNYRANSQILTDKEIIEAENRKLEKEHDLAKQGKTTVS